MRRTHRYGAATIVALLLVPAVACTGSSSTTSPSGGSTVPVGSTIEAGPKLEVGSKHSLIDGSGRFAFPAPRLAEKVKIEDSPDGTATVSFKVAYAVANASKSKDRAADRAVVLVRVARSMFTTGPQPNDPAFSKSLDDDELSGAESTRTYSVTLPADVRQHLESRGTKSDDPDLRAKALALLNVGVQQYRDFQVVDGKFDWIHGTAFNAAESPTKPADNPGGALTVRNDTATGIYSYNFGGGGPSQAYGPGLFPGSDFQTVTTDSTGVSVSLAGEAMSCFQSSKDGSNPEGFNVTLAPGTAVTQTIVVDDSQYDLPNDNTAAAAAADAMEDTLKAGVMALNVSFWLLFGGPFTLPIAMATNLLDLGEYCNNQPNLMQLGAVVENGQGSSSTTWAVWDGCGGTCGGFANYYTSPWQSSAPNIDAEVVTNAVQLAPDAGHTYQGQPLWLAQVPIQGCGVGNANDSNTSGCTSQNTISLRWTTQPACPWTNGLHTASGGVVGGVSWCFLPAPASPAVGACGTNNSECLSYDPNPS